MHGFASRVLQFSVSVRPAAVIREGLGVQPVLGKAGHFPRLAEQTTGPAILWTLTLVMCHGLIPHVCHFGGVAACLPSSPPLCGHRTHRCLFWVPRARFFCVVRHRVQLKEVISTCSRLFLASLTIFSSCLATRSSIQSAPHWLQTVAGTFRTTTTPNSKSAVNVVVPVLFVPAQRGHNFLDFFLFTSSSWS